MRDILIGNIYNYVGSAANDTYSFNDFVGGVADGGSGNDTFYGNAGADTLNGGAGNDTLNGGEGADTLNGGAGDDYIVAGLGDTLDGGDGIDTLYLSLATLTSGVQFLAGAAQPLVGAGVPSAINFERFNLTLTGQADLADLRGSSGTSNNTIDLGAGNDTVRVDHTTLGQFSLLDGGGTDTLIGDFSASSAAITASASSVQVANQTLLYLSNSNFEVVDFTGGSGNDTFYGSAGADTLNGGAGNDTLNGGGGNDRFNYGGSGATTITDFVAGGSEDFLAFDATWANTQFGTATPTRAAILAFGAQVGAHVVFTFSAGNTITLNNVTLGALTNSDFGLASSIDGTAGDDPALIGTADADTINGFGGNDVLNGLGGADTMVGGDGNDSYVVDNAGDVITEAAGAGTGYDVVTITAVTYTLSDNVEQGVATAGCTTITGSAQANYLYGGSSGLSLTLNGGDGDDVIYAGLAGGNTLSGGAGVDTLLIYGGNNTANGGTGSDIYYTYTTSDVLSEAGGDGIDTVFSNHDIVLGAGFEQLVLYGAATSATAGADNNIIYGNGATGGVTIDGGAGSDVIFGGANNDNLTGGAGVDLLFGQGGVNTLTGGDDTDIYYFAGGTDTVVETLTGGFDTIYSNNAGITVLAANVEQLILYGAATGGAGNDYIYANAAAAGVTLDGADGADYLLGSANADILIGGLGNDQSDLSTGGADRIRYDVAGNMGMDIVYGFDANDASGGHDRIDLSGLGYNAGAIGGAITLTDGGGGNTIVSFVGAGPLVGTTINLVGVAIGNMGAGDFTF